MMTYLLRRLATLCLLCTLWVVAGVAKADDAAPLSDADRAAIASIINQQVAAFRRDDAAEAFGYASPGIREMFGTPESFIRMVREAYPAVYRPRSFDLVELVERDGIVLQRASVVDPDGNLVTAVYVMERQPDGNWRIGGCYLLKAPGESA